MTFTVVLNDRTDIQSKIIDRLKTPKQIALVKREHGYAFSIYWSMKHRKWILHIDPFNSFGQDSEHGQQFLFALFHEVELTVHVIDSPRLMLYEIRQHITECTMGALLDEDPFDFSIANIYKEVTNSLGKQVMFGDDFTRGILVGLSATLEDMYFMYLDQQGKLQFETCVSAMRPVDSIHDDGRFDAILLDPKFEDKVFKQRMKHFVTRSAQEIELVSF